MRRGYRELGSTKTSVRNFANAGNDGRQKAQAACASMGVQDSLCNDGK
jgi:hypothetical protein